LATIGGSVYPPEIFEALESVDSKDKKELVYIDGINKLLSEGKKAYAVEIKNGRYFDCGNVLEYLKTNVEMALKREGISAEFTGFIKNIAKSL
jgi:UTP--glucose-1-phosphate uridylyltransferase